MSKWVLKGLGLVLGTVTVVATLVGLVILLFNLSSSSPPQDQTIEVPQLKPGKAQEVFLKKKTIKNVNINFDRTIYIEGEVGYTSMNKAIKNLKILDASSGPIYMLISSPGGSVFDGFRLISAIESSKNPVYTVCTSLCASMAAIIHQYGTKRYAYDRSVLMFHDAAGGLQGPVKHMQSMLTFLERAIEKTNRYIANKSHLQYEEFMQLHSQDLWIDAEDAKDLHLVDELIAVKDDASRDDSNPYQEKNNKNVVPYAPLAPKMPMIELEN